jgi:hypothetical protein
MATITISPQGPETVTWRERNKRPLPNRQGKSIATAFTSLSTGPAALPSRFSALKQDLSKGRESAILNGWLRLLERLEGETHPQIEARGSSLVPEVQYSDIVANGGTLPLDAEQELKRCGTIIVRGVVSRDEALGWKQQVQKYIKANPSTGGFPAGNIQIYEMYWSRGQLLARSHPNVITAQKAMNNVWHAAPTDPVVLSEPLSYADRLRIRTVSSTPVMDSFRPS